MHEPNLFSKIVLIFSMNIFNMQYVNNFRVLSPK